MRFLFLLTIPLFVFAQLQTRTQALMGTFVSITLPSKYNIQTSDSFAYIKEIENALSSYDSHASVYKLNQDHSVRYNEYLAEALHLSQLYYKETNGYFDITIGSISKQLYHFGEERSYTPSQEALSNISEFTLLILVRSTDLTSTLILFNLDFCSGVI